MKEATLTPGLTKALAGDRSLEACECGFAMPTYPGRYPSKCPVCSTPRNAQRGQPDGDPDDTTPCGVDESTWQRVEEAGLATFVSGLLLGAKGGVHCAARSCVNNNGKGKCKLSAGAIKLDRNSECETYSKHVAAGRSVGKDSKKK